MSGRWAINDFGKSLPRGTRGLYKKLAVFSMAATKIDAAITEHWRTQMAKTKYLRCIKCGIDATPTKSEVGTSTMMRCQHCCNPKDVLYLRGYPKHATMCRACCPSGHGTRLCSACGGLKIDGQSCGCFDNNCQ